MNIEELKKGLNKSLIIECVSVIVPILFYIFNVIVIGILGATRASEEAMGFIAFLLIAIMWIVWIALLFIKIFITIKAMNSCLDYFDHENDVKFKNNVSTAKTVYIIGIVLGFIPIVNLLTIGILIYNLLMWFIVKDRLNINIQTPNNQNTNISNSNNIELDKQS